jgi:hypothetical protein
MDLRRGYHSTPRPGAGSSFAWVLLGMVTSAVTTSPHLSVLHRHSESMFL